MTHPLTLQSWVFDCMGDLAASKLSAAGLPQFEFASCTTCWLRKLATRRLYGNL